MTIEDLMNDYNRDAEVAMRELLRYRFLLSRASTSDVANELSIGARFTHTRALESASVAGLLSREVDLPPETLEAPGPLAVPTVQVAEGASIEALFEHAIAQKHTEYEECPDPLQREVFRSGIALWKRALQRYRQAKAEKQE